MFHAPSPSYGNDRDTRASKPHGASAFNSSVCNTSASTLLAKVSHMAKPSDKVEGHEKDAYHKAWKQE